jgi:hypothetical protein
MAQVLSAIPLHGLEAVLAAANQALQSGRPSGEHVLNVLARLKQPALPESIVDTPLMLTEEPQANVARYERLRSNPLEDNHVA